MSHPWKFNEMLDGVWRRDLGNGLVYEVPIRRASSQYMGFLNGTPMPDIQATTSFKVRRLIDARIADRNAANASADPFMAWRRACIRCNTAWMREPIKISYGISDSESSGRSYVTTHYTQQQAEAFVAELFAPSDKPRWYGCRSRRPHSFYTDQIDTDTLLERSRDRRAREWLAEFAIVARRRDQANAAK